MGESKGSALWGGFARTLQIPWVTEPMGTLLWGFPMKVYLRRR
jgi:hypothetical protein